jgi:hypothetical protein
MLQDRELIYAIITHTPSASVPSEPSHVSVVLVDAECPYVDSINLIEHLAHRIVAVAPSEFTEDRRIPALRKDVAQKNTGA